MSINKDADQAKEHNDSLNSYAMQKNVENDTLEKRILKGGIDEAATPEQMQKADRFTSNDNDYIIPGYSGWGVNRKKKGRSYIGTPKS
ncbi:MAG: hypothetical protein AB1489_35970 [Acidobacteriota bacterium]